MVEEEKEKKINVNEEEVSLRELVKEFEEWLKEEEKKREEEPRSPFVVEREDVVYDMYIIGENSPVVRLLTLSVEGAVVATLGEEIVRIKQLLEEGKLVKIRYRTVEGWARVMKFLDVQPVELDGIKVPRAKVLKGTLVVNMDSVVISNGRTRFYVNQGSVGYKVLRNLGKLGVDKVVVLTGDIEKRTGPRGEYHRVTGVYVILPRPDRVKGFAEEMKKEEEVSVATVMEEAEREENKQEVGGEVERREDLPESITL